MATFMDWVSASFFNGIGVFIGINTILPVARNLEIFGNAYVIHTAIAAVLSGLIGIFSLQLFTNYITI